MDYEIIFIIFLFFIVFSSTGYIFWMLSSNVHWTLFNQPDRQCSLPEATGSESSKKSWKKPSHRYFSNVLIRIVTILAAGFAIYYLYWRLTTTFNQDALWFSWLLWLAELYGLLIFILFAFLTWELVNPKPPKPRSGIQADVFVTTYGEPVDILRATINACAQIRYPHQTYILDDTGREEIKALAASHDCIYIYRSDRKGAKAGAINYALKQSKGEFAAIMDADHIPLPTYLDDTLGFFQDPKVAIVQGPQLFYNQDSFEHNRSPWHEQRMFFHVIQPGKNRTKSAFWAGTPSVIRKSAIEAVGGVAEESVTEDLHTSIRLVSNGYYIQYIDRPLASGMAPATVEDFLGQRFRWAQGAMQIFRKDNPLTLPGLTLSQRISFFASMETYFDAIQKLVLFLIPLIILFTGLLPINTYQIPFWTRFIPYIFLLFFANWLLGRGSYNIWDILRFDTTKMFTFISAIRTLVTGHTRPFRVTNKVAGSKTRSPFQQVVTPHWIFIGITVIGIAIGIANIITPFLYVQRPAPIIIAIAWGMFDLYLLISVIFKLSDVSLRQRYRFPARIGIKWKADNMTEWEKAQTLDLSAFGLSFQNYSQTLQLDDNIKVAIPFAGMEETFFSSKVIREYSDECGNQRIGLAIRDFPSEEDADKYSKIVYSASGLLIGEDAVNPIPEETALKPWHRRILTAPISFRSLLKR
jgi:cellulose synthase (UDP-forming)